jgi:hypothetical protein
MKSSVWVILGIALSSYFAHSQINSGSIVVFNVSQDKAVMAADSRGVRSDGGPPNDAKCKIITCGGSGMFAATNVAGYVRGSDRRDFAWDSYDEATKVCDSIKGHSFSDASAEVNAMPISGALIWRLFGRGSGFFTETILSNRLGVKREDLPMGYLSLPRKGTWRSLAER